MTKANDNFPPHDPDGDLKTANGCLWVAILVCTTIAGGGIIGLAIHIARVMAHVP